MLDCLKNESLTSGILLAGKAAVLPAIQAITCEQPTPRPSKEVASVLAALPKLADVREPSYFTVVEALNMIGALGEEREDGIRQAVTQFPRTAPGMRKRLGDYVERMMVTISKEPSRAARDAAL